MGATKTDILRQFLAESLIQCLIGGAIGIGIGFAGALALRTYTSFPASVQTWVALLGVALSSIIGLFFGIYPARKAAGLDPVTALRTENGVTRVIFAENLSVAMDTLRARKVRSALTILGIVIGVTSVIAVASIIDGLNGVIKDQVSKLGSHTLFITRIPPARDSAACRRKSASGNTCRTMMPASSKNPAQRWRMRPYSPTGSTSPSRWTSCATATSTSNDFSCAAWSRNTRRLCRYSPWPRDGSSRNTMRTTRAA